MEKVLQEKVAALSRLLEEAESVLVAFSGGVDSTFLLAVAFEILGKNAIAATAVSPTHPFHEGKGAQTFTKARNIEHVLIESEEMTLSAFLANGPDRCYHCKKALFKQLLALAEKKGMRRVVHGANIDDLKDYRPGFQAAREMNIWAPLIDTEFTKDEIRLASKEKGLRTWNKPSGACLATRIPYGGLITREKLEMIGKAEKFLLEQGLRQCRVRYHDTVARIEVDQEGAQQILENDLRQAVVSKFKQLGFFHIALDLENYESGSMNRTIMTPPIEP